AALNALPINIAGQGEPTQVTGLRVTAGFFEILGVSPLIGRTIRDSDDVPGAPGVVVLGYTIWQQRFGGRADAIGQKMLLTGGPAEIVGVMPLVFQFPTVRAAIYVPMQINPQNAPRDGRNYSTVARLRPNVSVQSADAEMRSIAA